MAASFEIATSETLAEIVDAVASWQRDGTSVQVHNGDLGWAWRLGDDALAADVRAWRRKGELVAAGAVDHPSGLIRMALSPGVDTDTAFAARLLSDLTNDDAVLPRGVRTVEARFGTAFRDHMRRAGWADDESWTPLRRSLIRPVEDCGLEIRMLDADHAEDDLVADRVAVQRASFANSTFTVDMWQTMRRSPAYRRFGRCLVAYDRTGAAVAATTVWSAGDGRPGLIEPLGAHRDHRGRGYGRSITVAAAAALREMGASSVTVCTPSSNVAAVAAYASAGFDPLPPSTDFRRPDLASS